MRRALMLMALLLMAMPAFSRAASLSEVRISQQRDAYGSDWYQRAMIYFNPTADAPSAVRAYSRPCGGTYQRLDVSPERPGARFAFVSDYTVHHTRPRCVEVKVSFGSGSRSTGGMRPRLFPYGDGDPLFVASRSFR